MTEDRDPVEAATRQELDEIRAAWDGAGIGPSQRAIIRGWHAGMADRAYAAHAGSLRRGSRDG